MAAAQASLLSDAFLCAPAGAALQAPPYQLLQQPSVEVACGLCRGAQAVTAIYRRKGGVGEDCLCPSPQKGLLLQGCPLSKSGEDEIGLAEASPFSFLPEASLQMEASLFKGRFGGIVYVLSAKGVAFCKDAGMRAERTRLATTQAKPAP